MLDFQAFRRRLPATALALAVTFAPLAASAQDVPSYAAPVVVSTDETIHGRIASVDGAFNIHVSDDRGFVDNVVLHQGTIINPTGLALSAGMSVTIAGYNAGSAFDANEIDTPYSYSGELPVPAYYGAGYWYPGFAYGYGPSFSLAIIIGGGYDRFEHRPFYGRPWNGHGYFGDYVGRPYETRGFIGERRSVRPESNDGRRGFAGEVRRADAHPPQAFAGREFAGRAYPSAAGTLPGRGPTAYPSRSVGGSSPRSYGGYTRSASAPGGNAARSAPGAGNFARSAPGGGGFARSAPGGGGGFARSAPGGGGFARSAPGGGGASRGGPGASASHGGGVHH